MLARLSALLRPDDEARALRVLDQDLVMAAVIDGNPASVQIDTGSDGGFDLGDAWAH